MRPSQITGIAIAAFLTVTPAALAQTPPPPTQPPPTPPTQTQPTQTPPTETKSSDTAATHTFTGCLMTERDYRRAHNLGAGQIGGVGLGDEYVLVDAKISPAKATAATTPASDPSAAGVQPPSGASSKCADKSTAYRLTGSDEEQLRNLVGRHVEIQGRFKDPADAAASGARLEGTLPAEVTILSFRVAPVPAGVSPAAPTAQTPPKEPARPQTAPSPTTPTDPGRPQTASPPLPVPTVDPARDRATTPPATERRELPRTASSTGLFALIGVVALSSGLALTLIRRRLL
jgi:LPXTG-motif cell wall-anchored protein